jgi:hypothetical protein
MNRLRPATFPAAVLLAAGVAVVISVGDSAADLDNLVFTSRPNHLRLVVPRGWRASDLPTYPGLLLWMARSDPQGQMELTAEQFTHDLYCTWPIACRTRADPLPAKYACAVRAKLEAQRIKVGPVQPGPRDTEEAGVPSVWFEFDDGKHFLRQAVAFSTDRAISLTLVAPTSEARATHTRAFEQALRTLRPMSAEETARADVTAESAADHRDAGAGAPGDGSISVPTDAVTAADAGIIDAGAFDIAPTPKVDPVGPCPSN